MEKIPTAEEFWIENNAKGVWHSNILIEFAKLHVEAFRKEVKLKILFDAMETYGSEVPDCWSLTSVDDAYPLEKIK